MDINGIENLPDRIPTETLVLMFQEALVQFKNNEIDRTLSGLWNTNSYDEVDIILSIVVNLGLEICFNRIKESLKHYTVIKQPILNEIQQTIDEVGENISNPYYSLEKLN